MKTRRLDHIDLRVRDFKRARKFYERLLPELGFTCDRSDAEWGTFYSVGEGRPSDFFGFTVDPDHQPNERVSRFGRSRATKSIAWQNSCTKSAREIWKARKFAPVIVRDTTRCSSKIPTVTSWRSAIVKIQSLRSETSSAKSSIMNDAAHVPAILQEPRRVRYLKIIALFKIAKGALLFLLGFSLLFVNSRTGWLDTISDWADEELLLGHSKAVHFLLSRLQDVLAGGTLRATGLLALFYCAVLL